MNQSRTSHLRNFVYVSSASYIEYAIGFAVSILIARSLGPGEFGKYTFVIWLSGQLLLLTTNGIANNLLKFAGEAIGANARGQLSGIKRWHEAVAFLCCSVVIVGLVIFTLFAPPAIRATLTEWNVVLISLAVIFRVYYRLDVAFAQAVGDFAVASKIQSLGAVCLLGFMLACAAFKAEALAFFSVFVGVSFLQFLALKVLVIRKLNLVLTSAKLRDDRFLNFRNTLLYGAPFTLVAVCTWGAPEMLFLKNTGSNEAVAFFSISLTIAKATSELCVGALGALVNSTFATEMGKNGSKGVAKIIERVLPFFIVFALAGSVVGTLGTPLLITLGFGSKYHAAIPAIHLMVAAIFLYAITIPFSAAQLIGNRPKNRLAMAAVCAAVNILLSFFLIPLYGLIGAAIGYSCNLALYGLLCFVFVKGEFPFKLDGKWIAKILSIWLVAVVAAYLFFVPVTTGNVIGFCVTYMAVFFGALFKFQLLPQMAETGEAPPTSTFTNWLHRQIASFRNFVRKILR